MLHKTIATTVTTATIMGRKTTTMTTATMGRKTATNQPLFGFSKCDSVKPWTLSSSVLHQHCAHDITIYVKLTVSRVYKFGRDKLRFFFC